MGQKKYATNNNDIGIYFSHMITFKPTLILIYVIKKRQPQTNKIYLSPKIYQLEIIRTLFFFHRC